MCVDPLAEKTPTISPYTYAINNPMFFIDPDGMQSQRFDNMNPNSYTYQENMDDDGSMRIMSPIYGTNGNFLSTDEDGFEGEVLFMSEATFFAAGGKGMDSKLASSVGQNLEQVIGDNPATDFTQAEANMVNNAITDVVSRTQGYGFSAFGNILHNGKTSSSYWSQVKGNGTGGAWVTSNDGVNMGVTAYNNTDYDNNGQPLISYNLREYSGKNFTVANIQNAWVHEFGNHYLKNIPGGNGEAHAKAIYNQSMHPTWKDTTLDFKINMRNVYTEYTGRSLNR